MSDLFFKHGVITDVFYSVESKSFWQYWLHFRHGCAVVSAVVSLQVWPWVRLNVLTAFGLVPRHHSTYIRFILWTVPLTKAMAKIWSWFPDALAAHCNWNCGGIPDSGTHSSGTLYNINRLQEVKSSRNVCFFSKMSHWSCSTASMIDKACHKFNGTGFCPTCFRCFPPPAHLTQINVLLSGNSNEH